MSNEIYEKVEKICKKIDSYTEKDFSVKNKVKIESYSTKIKKLINMIEKAETTAQSIKMDTEQKENGNQNDNTIDNTILEEKYNPNSENFCYKERLEQLNGDIYILIKELREQDKIGYRNAYIINEIEKYVPPKANIKVRKKQTLWQKIKNLFRK